MKITFFVDEWRDVIDTLGFGENMKQYIMSITAQDRAGIVAGVSRAVVELQGNIEAASQTVHQGYFAMMLLCSFPKEVCKDGLREGICGQVGDDLHIYITEYEKGAVCVGAEGQPFIVTSIGPDRPGILQALADYLASKEINIDDLYAVVKDGDFVVICQVSVPGEVDIYMLQSDLEALGQSLGVVVQMQHEDIFVATNELALHKVRIAQID
ncbi:MAG: hypothetical protein JW936_11355 [Sedimentisphaerales bacterium]|nr:hypothetical protein [Sedimentisphaerales bacterium]